MILYSPVFVKKKRREPNFGEEVRNPTKIRQTAFFLGKSAGAAAAGSVKGWREIRRPGAAVCWRTRLGKLPVDIPVR